MASDLIDRMLKEFGGCTCELCAERMSRAAAVCQKARDAEWEKEIQDEGNRISWQGFGAETTFAKAVRATISKRDNESEH